MEVIGLITINVIVWGYFVYSIYQYTDFEVLKHNCKKYSMNDIEKQINESTISEKEKQMLRELMMKKIQ